MTKRVIKTIIEGLESKHTSGKSTVEVSPGTVTLIDIANNKRKFYGLTEPRTMDYKTGQTLVVRFNWEEQNARLMYVRKVWQKFGVMFDVIIE